MIEQGSAFSGTVTTLAICDRGLAANGDDSPLLDTWDEICAQVQCEHSDFWDVYEETATAVLTSLIAKLPPRKREALWLQTEQGFDRDWDHMHDADSECPVSTDEVVEYVWDEVRNAAANGSNKRIRAYLDAHWAE
jgi:hypothetical protein